MPRLAREIWRYSVHLSGRFRHDRGLELASSLTFTTLLSLVPLIMLVITVMSAFPMFSRVTANLDEWLVGAVLPDNFRGVVRIYLEQFTANAARLTTLGLAVLGVTAFMLALTIERAFNVIWRVTNERSLGQRIITYWATLTLGPVLFGASLTASSYLLGVSLGGAWEAANLQSGILSISPYLFTIAAYTLLYWLVPHRPVRFRHALLGALVAGVLFELVKRGFASYVAHFPAYRAVYGTFAIVPVFLLWVYLSWAVTILGAEVAAMAPDWRQPTSGSTVGRGAEILDVIAVLRALLHGQRRSLASSPDEIAFRTGLARERVQGALISLERDGWVGRVGAGAKLGWAVLCDPDRVMLGDILGKQILDTTVLGERLAAMSLPTALVDELFGLAREMPLSALTAGRESAAGEA